MVLSTQKRKNEIMITWEIDKKTEMGNISVCNIRFVTHNRKKWIQIVGTTLSGGTITNRAGIELIEGDFSHNFSSVEEVWNHLLDKTPAGSIFLQLMINECNGFINVTASETEKRRLAFEAEAEERRRKEGGNKRKPGIVREDASTRNVSCSSQIMRPDWFLE